MLDLPLYKAYISDDMDGIYSISLVNSPATEYTMQLFKSDKLDFSIENEDQHLIKTVVMLCDSPIYRNDYGYEYYVAYDKPTLAYMAQKMLRDNLHNQFEIEHNGATLPKGCIELVELFQKDIEHGIDPSGFESVNDGSLLATYKVNDEGIWNMCKNGTFAGVSLSGYFNLTEEQFSKINKKYTFKMTINKLKELLKNVLLEYNSCESSIGQLYYNGDELMVGTPVTDKNGEPIKDGEIKVDGYDLTIKNGAVESMTPTASNEEQPKEEEQQPTEEPVTEEVKEDEPKEDEKEPETPKAEEETPKVEEEPTEPNPTDDTPVEEPQAQAEEVAEEVAPLVEAPTEQNDISALKAEIDSLKNAVSELLVKISQPVEKSIIDESKENFSAQYSDDNSYEGLPKGFERLMKRVSYLRKE